MGRRRRGFSIELEVSRQYQLEARRSGRCWRSCGRGRKAARSRARLTSASVVAGRIGRVAALTHVSRTDGGVGRLDRRGFFRRCGSRLHELCWSSTAASTGELGDGCRWRSTVRESTRPAPGPTNGRFARRTSAAAGQRPSGAGEKEPRARSSRAPTASSNDWRFRSVPQVWLTLIWHMGLRMPWSWRSGPSTASERDHFQQMLCGARVPEKHTVLRRRGLHGLRVVESGDRPRPSDSDSRRREREAVSQAGLLRAGARRDRVLLAVGGRPQNQPPLVLRLIRFRLGRGEAYVVTSVLESRRLSERQGGAAVPSALGSRTSIPRTQTNLRPPQASLASGPIGRWSSWTGLSWD